MMKKAVQKVITSHSSNDQSIRTLCTEIASQFNVNPDSLRRAVIRAKKPKEKSHGHQLLTDHEELLLCGVLIALDSAAIPQTPQEVIAIVRKWKNGG